jgi:hypothetical protein
MAPAGRAWSAAHSTKNGRSKPVVFVAVFVFVFVVAPGDVAGRVAPGDRSPGAPTDPDLRDSRIRLLSREIR